MNPSDELKGILIRFYEGESCGDPALAERFFSHQEGMLAIGTDPGEWWASFDELDRLFKEQANQAGIPIQIIPGELRAFAEGTAGWVVDNPVLRLSNGREIPLRVTTVFHREDGQWRIVLHHASIGVPNAEVLSG